MGKRYAFLTEMPPGNAALQVYAHLLQVSYIRAYHFPKNPIICPTFRAVIHIESHV